MYVLWSKPVNGYYSKTGDWIPDSQICGRLSELCIFRTVSDASDCRKTLHAVNSLVILSESTFKQRNRQLRHLHFSGSLKPNYNRSMDYGGIGIGAKSKPEPGLEPEATVEQEQEQEPRESIVAEPKLPAVPKAPAPIYKSPTEHVAIVHGIRPVNPTGESLTYPEYLDRAAATVRVSEDAPIYAPANISETCETEFIRQVLGALKGCKNILDALRQRKKGLEDELFTLDLMTSDELHRIEFNNLNAVQGYVAYKQLHDVRIQRRRVKNELFAIGAVQIAFNDPTKAVRGINEAIENIDGLKQRCYRVRVPERADTHD